MDTDINPASAMAAVSRTFPARSAPADRLGHLVLPRQVEGCGDWEIECGNGCINWNDDCCDELGNYCSIGSFASGTAKGVVSLRSIMTQSLESVYCKSLLTLLFSEKHDEPFNRIPQIG